MQMELTWEVLLREKKWKRGRGGKRWPLWTEREERDTEKDKEEEEREVDRVLPLKGTGCCLSCTQA